MALFLHRDADIDTKDAGNTFHRKKCYSSTKIYGVTILQKIVFSLYSARKSGVSIINMKFGCLIITAS